MKLSSFKNHLKGLHELIFLLPNGQTVPAHFHITEVGQATKKFIDCGGTIRNEKKVVFQLWEANDLDHRLKPEKLINIIELAENKLELEDVEIEVEYQDTTIGKYNLEMSGNDFQLIASVTDCLAPDKCGVPADKLKVNLKDLSPTTNACCTPGSKCC